MEAEDQGQENESKKLVGMKLSDLEWLLQAMCYFVKK